MARRLRAANVHVEEIIGYGAIHGFLNLPFPAPQSEPVLAQLSEKLNNILKMAKV